MPTRSDGPPQFLTAAVDTLPINMAVLDAEGVILETNEAWQEFGAENDIEMRPDTTGVNYLHVTEEADDEYARRAATGLKEVLDGERDLFRLEYPCSTPEEDLWFLMRAARFTHQGSEYASVAHIDITDRKRREKDLRREYRRYETLTETAPDAIVLVSRDTGGILEANSQAATLTGYDQEQLTDMRYPALYPDEEKYESLHAAHAARIEDEESMGTTVSEFEDGSDILIEEPSGDTRPVEINASLLELDDDSLLLAILRDITRRKRAERRLERQRDQLELLNQVVRHDIRNDLQLVLTYTDLLDEHVDDEAREYLEHIRESAANAVDLDHGA